MLPLPRFSFPPPMQKSGAHSALLLDLQDIVRKEYTVVRSWKVGYLYYPNVEQDLRREVVRVYICIHREVAAMKLHNADVLADPLVVERCL
jgi:hypothetical protein